MDKKITKNQSSFIISIGRLLDRIDTGNAKQLANIVYLFIAFHFFLWFSVGFFSQRAPHWDNVEALVWSQHLAWGYFKHPPFATWIVHFFVTVFGRYFWVTYLVGQLSVALMLLVAWRVALLLTTPMRAAASVVLTSLVIYHNVWGIVANHNTLQLLPVSLLLWSTLVAVRQPQWWRWALVGVIAAICMLTKYSAVIWIAALGLWMVGDQRMHRLKPWIGIALAALIVMVAFIPHVQWMMREGYQTLKYLENQTQQHTNYFFLVGRFLISQVGRLSPLLIAWGLLYVTFKRYRLKNHASRYSNAHANLGATFAVPSEWRFISMMTWLPLILALLAGAFMMNLRVNWGTTFFIFSGLFAIRWLPVFDEKILFQSVLKYSLVINLLIACGMVISNGWLVDITGRTSRVNFPTYEFTKKIDQVWSESMGDQPLRLVAAETWLAGIASVKSRYHPTAFLYGRRARSPWVTEKMIHDCGVLLLLDRRTEKNRLPPPNVVEMMKSATYKGTIEIPWSRRKSGPMLTVEWGIVEPIAKGLCKI